MASIVAGCRDRDRRLLAGTAHRLKGSRPKPQRGRPRPALPPARAGPQGSHYLVLDFDQVEFLDCTGFGVPPPPCASPAAPATIAEALGVSRATLYGHIDVTAARGSRELGLKYRDAAARHRVRS